MGISMSMGLDQRSGSSPLRLLGCLGTHTHLSTEYLYTEVVPGGEVQRGILHVVL